jgi:hypothetical protein
MIHFPQDLLVAALFRNFLLAERVMRAVNCTPVSQPPLPPTHQHPLWQVHMPHHSPVRYLLQLLRHTILLGRLTSHTTAPFGTSQQMRVVCKGHGAGNNVSCDQWQHWDLALELAIANHDNEIQPYKVSIGPKNRCPGSIDWRIEGNARVGLVRRGVRFRAFCCTYGPKIGAGQSIGSQGAVMAGDATSNGPKYVQGAC